MSNWLTIQPETEKSVIVKTSAGGKYRQFIKIILSHFVHFIIVINTIVGAALKTERKKLIWSLWTL